MGQQWEGKSRGNTSGYRIFIWILRHIGLEAAYVLLCFVVPYFILFAPRQTRSTWIYARRILGYSRVRASAFLVRSYFAFGKSIIDKVAAGSGFVDRFSFEFENHSEVLKLMESGKGYIAIGAHVGSWQVGAPFFEKYGQKINVVMYDHEREEVKKVIEGQVEAESFKIIPIAADGLSHIFSITEALEKGELVCFQGDRYVEGEKVQAADFMGRKADFPLGPFFLAARLKVPVVFYFAMREKGRKYRFHFIFPQMQETLSAGRRADAKAAAEILLKEYLAFLESILRKYPEQWFNYYDFWNLYDSKKSI